MDVDFDDGIRDETQKVWIWVAGILIGALVLIAIFPVVREVTDPLLPAPTPVNVVLLTQEENGSIEYKETQMDLATVRALGFELEMPREEPVETFMAVKKLMERDLLYQTHVAERIERFCRQNGNVCTEFDRYYLGYKDAESFVPFGDNREELIINAIDAEGNLTEKGRVFDTFDSAELVDLCRLVMRSVTGIRDEQMDQFRVWRDAMGSVRVVGKRPWQILFRGSAKIVNETIDLVQAVAILAFRNRVQRTVKPIVLNPSSTFTLRPYVERKRGVVRSITRPFS